MTFLANARSKISRYEEKKDRHYYFFLSLSLLSVSPPISSRNMSFSRVSVRARVCFPCVFRKNDGRRAVGGEEEEEERRGYVRYTSRLVRRHIRRERIRLSLIAL